MSDEGHQSSLSGGNSQLQDFVVSLCLHSVFSSSQGSNMAKKPNTNLTLVEMTRSPLHLQPNKAKKETEPPSNLEVNNPHDTSFSSIEIEPLSREPRAVKKSEIRIRSNSLSRTLMNSFRRMKNNSKEENAETKENEDPATATDVAQDGQEEPGESKISRMLRLGSMRRRNKSASSLSDGNLALSPSRSTSITNFFKRERKDKSQSDANLPSETDYVQSEKSQLGKRRSSVRDSFMRRFRNSKSIEVTDENDQLRRKPRRSASMFAGSFGLKKMFPGGAVVEVAEPQVDHDAKPTSIIKRANSKQKLPQAVNSAEETKLTSILKRSNSKQKLSQVDNGAEGRTEEPEQKAEESEAQTVSHGRRNSFGEKLKLRPLFARDSFTTNKPKSSISDRLNSEPAAPVKEEEESEEMEETEETEEECADDEEASPDEETQEPILEVENSKAESPESKINPDDIQAAAEIKVNNESAANAKDEANGTFYTRLRRYRDCCMNFENIWRVWILQLCFFVISRPVIHAGFLFVFLLCFISCGVTST